MTTNRTDPLFQGTTMLNTVNLGITTFCSMKCPECHVGVPKLLHDHKARHASLDEIDRDAKHMQGLRRVHITGGEPTLHPRFRDIVIGVQAVFNCELLTIETNGYWYTKYRDLFQTMFDRVFITHYTKDRIYPGSPDNTAIIEMAQYDLGTKLIREPPVEHMELPKTLSLIGGPDEPCSKWHNPGLPCAWYNGKLYACCTTFGIDESLGIPVTANWKDEIIKQSKGCAKCVFKGT